MPTDGVNQNIEQKSLMVDKKTDKTNNQPYLLWHVVHLLAIGGTFGALLGGMRIATLDHPTVMRFTAILPQGDMHSYHTFFGALAFFSLMSLLILGKKPSGGWRKALFTFGILTIGLTSVSGALLYYFGDREGLAALHYYLALGILLYLFIHSVSYGLLRLFKQIKKAIELPSIPTKKGYIATAVPAVLFVLFWLTIGQSDTQKLYAGTLKGDADITIDANADEEEWKKAKEETIYAYGGGNFFDGATTIKIKALKDRHNIYFFISWKDPTKSQLHLPLVKGKHGWRVKEDGFYNYDELQYYEDKLAVLLSNDCTMGAGKSVHLGHKPLADHQATWHKRGYHYTTDGTIRDMWHWKAVRSDPMKLADDDFFGPPATQLNGKRRYKAGYVADGKDSGGISMNWKWYTPHGVTPKKLPYEDEKTTIKPTQAIPWYHFTKYTKAKDNYPEGAMLPSVLLKANTLEGDQADVHAKGEWKEGWWHLEMVRALDTHSPNDLPIKPGICLWVSAFDHVQVRHTRHAKPLQLEYKE